MSAQCISTKLASQLRVAAVVLALALLCFAPPLGASPLFMVLDNTQSGDVLLSYDAGTISEVGNIGYTDVRGLAYDARTGKLYGATRNDVQISAPSGVAHLLEIDMVTGAGTPVGSAPYLPAGSNSSELTVDSLGAMFGIGHVGDMTAVDTLLSVNQSTGVATVIGNLGNPVITGLASDHRTGLLYATTFWGQIYLVDENGPSMKFVGQISGTQNAVARIAFDQATGVLWGVTNLDPQLVTIDLSTLIASPVVSIPTRVNEQVYSLDFISEYTGSVPEPAEGTLILLGLVILASVHLKSRHGASTRQPTGIISHRLHFFYTQTDRRSVAPCSRPAGTRAA